MTGFESLLGSCFKVRSCIDLMKAGTFERECPLSVLMDSCWTIPRRATDPTYRLARQNTFHLLFLAAVGIPDVAYVLVPVLLSA